MRRFIATVTLLGAAVGCVPPVRVDQLSVQDLASKVTVEKSEFQKATVYVGAPISDDVLTRYFIRSFVKPGTATDHQLYVRTEYDGKEWIFYETAADDNGDLHKVISIERHVISCGGPWGSCSFSETFGVDVSDSFLRARQATGFKVQLSSRNGSGAFVVHIPPNYVQAQLAALPATP